MPKSVNIIRQKWGLWEEWLTPWRFPHSGILLDTKQSIFLRRKTYMMNYELLKEVVAERSSWATWRRNQYNAPGMGLLRLCSNSSWQMLRNWWLNLWCKKIYVPKYSRCLKTTLKQYIIMLEKWGVFNASYIIIFWN